MKRNTITERLLQKALIELLQNKSIYEVNVKDVCNKAEINRSTFYLHYKNVFELLEQIEAQELKQFDSFIKQVNNPQNMEKMMLAHFSYIKKNLFFYQVFLNGQNYKFESKFIEVLKKYHPLKEEIDYDEYAYDFFCQGCLALTKDWVKKGCLESETEMTKILMGIINRVK